jgi:FixJ family two-component response regulator
MRGRRRHATAVPGQPAVRSHRRARGPDIARRLGVSLNTVRTHTQHVYAKLGVTNRRAAVRRATEIELL